MDPFATYYLLDASQYDDDDDETRNARRGRGDHRGRGFPGLIRQPQSVMRSRTPVRVVPAATPVIAPAAPSGGVLGNLDKSELAALLGQAVAALMPLPAGPNSTGDVGKDVSNQTLYLAALALHIKRAEQLRLLGDAIAAFLD